MGGGPLVRVKGGMVDRSEVCIASNIDYAIGIYQLWEDVYVTVRKRMSWKVPSPVPSIDIDYEYAKMATQPCLFLFSRKKCGGSLLRAWNPPKFGQTLTCLNSHTGKKTLESYCPTLAFQIWSQGRGYTIRAEHALFHTNSQTSDGKISLGATRPAALNIEYWSSGRI